MAQGMWHLSLCSPPVLHGPEKSARATTINRRQRGGRNGRGGWAEPSLVPPPARLSARGAGPDVTLVRAAAHGRPDALSPALRGRGARGSSGGRRGEGGGVGRRAASVLAGRGHSSAVSSALLQPSANFFFLFCNFEHFAKRGV